MSRAASHSGVDAFRDLSSASLPARVPYPGSLVSAGTSRQRPILPLERPDSDATSFLTPPDSTPRTLLNPTRETALLLSGVRIRFFTAVNQSEAGRVSLRIGIDVGGTFTDFCVYDDATGEVRVEKVPTTPSAPEEGCLAAIDLALSPQDVPTVEYFLHGTTVGLNALLQRRGATVALLVTRGFRDSLELRRGNRGEPYNLLWRPAPPLVPRRLRLPISERVSGSGELLAKLSTADLQTSFATLKKDGVNSIAVCFLNAYANPENELAAEQELRRLGFAGPISLSHRLSGEYGEYERTSTTVVDAFVSRTMEDYIRRLDAGSRKRGFNGSLLITRSGGGAMTAREAQNRPFETIMSGPVAGASGAAELSRMLDLGDLVTADVGGTSFDTCLITDGAPNLQYRGSVDDMPLQAPWVDVRSIGAGGGSIAFVDAGGLLRVGPRSAGSVPGPACYGRGGREPTVTDAALVLGMLGEGKLASGLQLDIAGARASLDPIARRLDRSVDDVARGIILIAGSSMAAAIRTLTIERGLDPRKLKLLAFGGAGPLMATQLACELDIDTVIVPPYCGNFSAWGLLGADLLRSASQTLIVPLDESGLQRVATLSAAQFSELETRTAGAISPSSTEAELSLDLRYKGQEHSLTVGIAPELLSLPPDEAVEQLHTIFADAYARAYDVALDQPIEVVAVRATQRRRLARRTTAASLTLGGKAFSRRHMNAYSFSQSATASFALLDRAELPMDVTLSGPAVITEPTATTYVDAEFDIRVGVGGCLFLTRRAGVAEHH